MKRHMILAGILGSLTIGYTALANGETRPDSFESIAYVQNAEYVKVSKRFLRSSGSVRHVQNDDSVPRKRGLTALV